jgi:hypothetical protein
LRSVDASAPRAESGRNTGGRLLHYGDFTVHVQRRDGRGKRVRIAVQCVVNKRFEHGPLRCLIFPPSLVVRDGEILDDVEAHRLHRIPEHRVAGVDVASYVTSSSTTTERSIAPDQIAEKIRIGLIAAVERNVRSDEVLLVYVDPYSLSTGEVVRPHSQGLAPRRGDA